MGNIDLGNRANFIYNFANGTLIDTTRSFDSKNKNLYIQTLNILLENEGWNRRPGMARDIFFQLKKIELTSPLKEIEIYEKIQNIYCKIFNSNNDNNLDFFTSPEFIIKLPNETINLSRESIYQLSSFLYFKINEGTLDLSNQKHEGNVSLLISFLKNCSSGKSFQEFIDLNPESLIDIFLLAKDYQIPELAEICLTQMQSSLNELIEKKPELSAAQNNVLSFVEKLNQSHIKISKSCVSLIQDRMVNNEDWEVLNELSKAITISSLSISLKDEDLSILESFLKNTESIKILILFGTQNINLTDCYNLKSIESDDAKQLDLVNCYSLVQIDSHNAEKINVINCQSIRKVNSPCQNITADGVFLSAAVIPDDIHFQSFILFEEFEGNRLSDLSNVDDFILIDLFKLARYYNNVVITTECIKQFTSNNFNIQSLNSYDELYEFFKDLRKGGISISSDGHLVIENIQEGDLNLVRKLSTHFQLNINGLQLSGNVSTEYLEGILNIYPSIAFVSIFNSAVEQLDLKNINSIGLKKCPKLITFTTTNNLLNLKIENCNSLTVIGPAPNLNSLSIDGVSLNSSNFDFKSHLQNEVNLNALKSYAKYINGNEISIPDINAIIDLLFLCKNIDQPATGFYKQLYIACLTTLLNRETNLNNITSKDNEKIQFITLIKKSKNNIFIKENTLSITNLNKEIYIDVCELLNYFPIDFSILEISKKIDTKCTEEFLKAQPSIIEISLEKCINIDDDFLGAVLNLPQLKRITISECEVINLSFKNKLDYLKFNKCDLLENIEAETVECFICIGCSSLEEVSLSNGNKCSITNCSNLRTYKNLIGKQLKLIGHNLLRNIKLENLITLHIENNFSTKLIDTPTAKEIVISNAAVEKISSRDTKNLILSDCYSLTTLNFTNLEILSVRNCPNIQNFNINGEGLIQLNMNNFPKANLTERQKSLIETISKLKINPASFSLGSQIEVPTPPKLELSEAVLEEAVINNTDFKFLSSIYTNRVLFKCIQPKFPFYKDAKHVKIGGVIYSHKQLADGIQNLINAIEKSTLDIVSLKKINAFLADLIYNIKNYNVKNYGVLWVALWVRLGVFAVDYKNNNQAEELIMGLQFLIHMPRFLALFHNINFTNPAKPGYFNPKNLKDDNNKAISIETLKCGLHILLGHVLSRSAYTGTPPEETPKELNLYYHNLESYLECIIVYLKKMEGDDELMDKQLFLIDLGISGLHCGERWIGDAEQIYAFLSQNFELLSFENRIYMHDANFRMGIVESLSQRGGVINVHKYNQYKRLLGKKYGLRGAEALENINDTFSNPNLTQEIADKQFEERYNVITTIINQKHFLNSFMKDFSQKDAYLNFLKHTMPKEWEEMHFNDVIQELKKMEEEEIPPAEIRKQLMEKYQDKGVYICPVVNDSPSNFLDDIRVHTINPLYLHSLIEKDADDNPLNTLTIEAVAHILQHVSKLIPVDDSEEEIGK